MMRSIQSYLHLLQIFNLNDDVIVVQQYDIKERFLKISLKYIYNLSDDKYVLKKLIKCNLTFLDKNRIIYFQNYSYA